MSHIKGQCRCGAVRFAASTQPHTSSYCHCADCRRSTGGPVAAFVGFNETEVEWQAEGHAAWANPPVERLFCPNCGSPVGYRDDRLAGRIYFYTGILDAPEEFPPTIHAYAPQQLPWLELTDDLPRMDATSVDRPTQS